MQRGDVSYAHSGETTEWDDILINKGILTKDQVLEAKRPGLAAEVAEREAEEVVRAAALEAAIEYENRSLEERLQEKTQGELEEVDEDALDDDEHEVLQRLREQRLEEMRAAAVLNRFGDVKDITKEDWVREVTDASKEAGGCWVIVHLYEDAVDLSRAMGDALRVVAAKFAHVKFVRIRSILAVENWPERNVPTLFLYHNGELQKQVLAGNAPTGRLATPRDIEWYLASENIVRTELESNPSQEAKGVHKIDWRSGARTGRRWGDEDDDDEEDEDDRFGREDDDL